MAFVEQHHPELQRLLKHLKLAAPTEYQKAIQELFRTSERLAVIRDRAPQRYRIELQIWQARSRAQLLSARLKMATDPELVNELRTLLAKKIDLELELLERERRRHLERLERIEKQMERKKSTREAVLERQVRMLSHAARNHRGRASGENKKRNSTK